MQLRCLTSANRSQGNKFGKMSITGRGGEGRTSTYNNEGQNRIFMQQDIRQVNY